jgi:acetyl esterase/lipase
MPDTFIPQRRLPPLVKDLCYLRHGERELAARVFMPVYDGGPFPCLIDLHGGGWQRGDLEYRKGLGQYAGHVGCVVVSLNFRHGADAYPSSLIDINYGIRWVKANAARFRVDPGRVVIGGNSTGGHLAMLAAMRPREPRYAAIPLPEGSPRVDASVQAVVMHWPIINPLSRYRSLLLEKGRFRYGVEYWQTEANAAEGNPMLMLERGERVDLPRAVWIQGRPDPLHDYRDPDSDFPGNEPERFVSAYRQAGGKIELVYFPKESGDTHALHLTRKFLRQTVGAF